MSGITGSIPANNKSESLPVKERGGWIFPLILVLITLAELFFAYRHSDFNNDDLDHFALAARSGLLAYMLTPVELIHIVPFHRLLTFLIYRIAPMNFVVALALLGSIHGITLYYLYKISRLLRAGIFGNVIIIFYALSILNIALFVWWASAAHRIPYLALSACLAYHYMASLREDAARRHSIIAAIAFLIGCGFYIKMILVPFYLAVYGLALIGFAGKSWRRVLFLPSLLVVGSIIYLLIYSHFVHPGHVGIWLAIKLDSEYLIALCGNLLGFTLDSEYIQTAGLLNVWTVGVISIWLAIVFVTTRLNGRALFYWLLLFSLLFLDFFPIARSDRSLYFANIVPYSVRYHADALVIVAVMLLIIAAALRRNAVESKHHARLVLAICATSIYACAMAVNLNSASAQRSLMFSTFAHSYMHNLRKGLKKIHEKHPSFVISPVPKGIDWAGDITASDSLVRLFRPQATFSPTHGDYRVLDDGHIQSVDPK